MRLFDLLDDRAVGDLLVVRTNGSRNLIGRGAVVRDEQTRRLSFASYLIRLRLLDKSLLPKFVSLFFQTAGYWKTVKEGSSGSAQGGFNATKLGALIIPIPPISEQQRIVGLLDEAFAGLATAKANAETNLQNARALFESHLQSVFTQRGDGWVEKKLGDVCVFENGDRGKNYPNRNEYVDSGIPWINTGHIQPDGTLSMEEMNFITRKNSTRSEAARLSQETWSIV